MNMIILSQVLTRTQTIDHGISLKLPEILITHAITNKLKITVNFKTRMILLAVMVVYSSLLEWLHKITKDNNSQHINKIQIQIVVVFNSLHVCKEKILTLTKYNSPQGCRQSKIRIKEHLQLKIKINHQCSNCKNSFKEIVLITQLLTTKVLIILINSNLLKSKSSYKMQKPIFCS